MTTPSISRYPVPKLEDLPEDIRARMLEVQEKAGFMPNVFLALAHRPDEFRAFFAYHDALMLRESGLTKAEREMIVVAISGANDCLYCFVAHGAILRIYAKNPLVADQVGVNYRKADITPRQNARCSTFALKVAERGGEIDDADYAALRAHGFDDEDIWDIGDISAFFCLSNRMANLIGHAAERRVLPAGPRAEAEVGIDSALAAVRRRHAPGAGPAQAHVPSAIARPAADARAARSSRDDAQGTVTIGASESPGYTPYFLNHASILLQPSSASAFR